MFNNHLFNWGNVRGEKYSICNLKTLSVKSTWTSFIQLGQEQAQQLAIQSLFECLSKWATHHLLKHFINFLNNSSLVHSFILKSSPLVSSLPDLVSDLCSHVRIRLSLLQRQPWGQLLLLPPVPSQWDFF